MSPSFPADILHPKSQHRADMIGTSPSFPAELVSYTPSLSTKQTLPADIFITASPSTERAFPADILLHPKSRHRAGTSGRHFLIPQVPAQSRHFRQTYLLQRVPARSWHFRQTYLFCAPSPSMSSHFRYGSKLSGRHVTPYWGPLLVCFLTAQTTEIITHQYLLIVILFGQ